MCLYIFLGQSFFIKFCRMLGHQTPSKAPEMSNMNPIAYFQVDSSTMFLSLIMASTVLFPGLNPCLLLEASGWL